MIRKQQTDNGMGTEQNVTKAINDKHDHQPENHIEKRWRNLNSTRVKTTPFSDPTRFTIETPYREYFEEVIVHCPHHPKGELLIAGHIEKRPNQLIFGPLKLRIPGSTKTFLILADNLYWKSDSDLKGIAEWMANSARNKSYNKASIHYHREPEHNSTSTLVDELKHAGLTPIQLESSDLYLTELASDHADLPSLRMKAKNRYKERKKLKDLQKTLGEVEFRSYSTPEQEEEFFRSVEAMSHNVWQVHNGLGNVRDTPRFRNIYRYESQRGGMLSYILFAGGKPIAFQFGTLYQEVYHYEFVGFDSDYQTYSPGQLLRIHTFDLIQKIGCKCIDFGPGGYEYKKQWGTRLIKLPEIEIYSNGIESTYVKLISRTNERIKKSLRNVRQLYLNAKTNNQ